MIILRIAFRNIAQNKWRSLLIGFALFISSFFLLVSNSAMNGIEDQVIRGYVNYQSGHVAVMWPGMKDVSSRDAGRFLFLLESYDPHIEGDNLTAIEALNQFLTENQAAVDKAFPSIMRLGRYTVGTENDQIVIFGLTQEHAEYLQNSRTLMITEGELPDSSNPGIAISEFSSTENGVNIGDSLLIRVATPNRDIREQEFTITGIYANGAGYDNHFAFMTDLEARNLTDVPQPLFDIHRIYLQDSGQAGQFAQELDQALAETVLFAESFREASPFYTNNSRNMRAMFNIFLIFILIVIAFGLVATIRMNLFERMKEFGTLRAMGYSRSQNFGIIFAEMFILAFLSLLAALVISVILVSYLGSTGIFVGTGPISYGIGGERFWPEMRIKDIVLAITAITAFAVFATLGPGLNLCYQGITDMMLKKQSRMFLPSKIIREWRETGIGTKK